MKGYYLNFVFLILALAGGLSGCGKKHEEEKSHAKADESIVTLTQANLEHVEIKTEPVARGTLSTTPASAGSSERKSQ